MVTDLIELPLCIVAVGDNRSLNLWNIVIEKGQVIEGNSKYNIWKTHQ